MLPAPNESSTPLLFCPQQRHSEEAVEGLKEFFTPSDLEDYMGASPRPVPVKWASRAISEACGAVSGESPATLRLLLEQRLGTSKSRLERSIPTSGQRGSNSCIGVAKIRRCAHVAGKMATTPKPELQQLRDGCMMGFAFRTEIPIDADKAFYS
jgi:hypothetical protein